MPSTHTGQFFDAMNRTIGALGPSQIDKMATEINKVRHHGGRLFVLGVGGGAANASHAVNDFRKLCNVEAYAPTDNVAELTARTNDDGWKRCFEDWLMVSGLHRNDALLIFSVGGGNARVSPCIAAAVTLARAAGARVLGVVGRSEGITAQHGDCVVVVPKVSERWVTPLTETMQVAILHCLVNHPLLSDADAMARQSFREFSEAETTEGA